ncbi:MAG TPA: hypothetical protein PK715_15365, partial [Chitinophagales bacterium]|nr:hypothetical protein [Chitinophagales bacterium]
VRFQAILYFTQRRKEKREGICMYLANGYHSNLWRVCRLTGKILHKERKVVATCGLTLVFFAANEAH